MWPATAWTPSGWRVLGSFLGHFMLRRTEEVVGLPRKYETLVPCPLAPLQASWYTRLLSSDTATASVLTVSQLKTLIMQLRKICNHPRTLLGSAKDTAAAAAAGAAAAAAVSSSSSSKTPMGGGGKRGERLRQELAALTGEERMQASVNVNDGRGADAGERQAARARSAAP